LSKMRFLCRVAISTLCAASCAALGVACDDSGSANGSAGSSAGFGPSPQDAGADAADAEPAPDSLAFQPSSTLTLAPKATQTLTVATTPAGIFRVRFALLGSGPDNAPGDAALDASEVDTNGAGVAQVTLTAPSMPTTFSVRASVGSKAQAELGVSISASDFTTLRVLPSYSGKRLVTSWTATARAGVTCAKLVGNPPPDGDLLTTAAVGKDLDLAKVPIGVDLAVTLRAGHYIGGCADQSALTETDGNQVLVYASDRPVNLDATVLGLEFGPTAPKPALSKLMSAAVSSAESALSGGATSDVAALLDAMQDATLAASRDAFSAARTLHTWDAALTTAFGIGASTRLRDPADRWLGAGLVRFYAADTFSGQLGSVAGGALLTLTAVAQIPATSAGFPASFPTTWSADSSDTLLLGTELSWVPSRLVTALAIAPALLDFPTATTLEGALAQSVDCTLVGKTLLAHGTVVGSAVYDGCDQNCAVSACTSAVAALWKSAGNASGNTNASLTVTGTGAAQVGDDASVTSLGGSWVGELQIGADTAPASGALSASAVAQ
jgi:hypothetical protein